MFLVTALQWQHPDGRRHRPGGRTGLTAAIARGGTARAVVPSGASS